MGRYYELLEIFGSDDCRLRHLKEKDKDMCIRCGKSAGRNIDSDDKLDCGISGLCTDCFNLSCAILAKDEIKIITKKGFMPIKTIGE